MSQTIKINGPSPVPTSEKQPEGGSSLGVFAALKQRRQSTISSNTEEDVKPAPANLFRRRSTFKGIATTLLNMRRMTKPNIAEETKPKVRMENTYKTCPDEGTQFKTKKIETFVNNILERELCNEKYNPERCKTMACDLSVKIKMRVKNMDIPRYKIIVNVVIGQCLDQGLEMASQSIWSPTTDNFTCCSYKNSSLFAVALVHGVYYE